MKFADLSYFLRLEIHWEALHLIFVATCTHEIHILFLLLPFNDVKNKAQGSSGNNVYLANPSGGQLYQPVFWYL